MWQRRLPALPGIAPDGIEQMAEEAAAMGAKMASKAASVQRAYWRSWLEEALSRSASPAHRLLKRDVIPLVSDRASDGKLHSNSEELLDFEASAWLSIWRQHSESEARSILSALRVRAREAPRLEPIT